MGIFSSGTSETVSHLEHVTSMRHPLLMVIHRHQAGNFFLPGIPRAASMHQKAQLTVNRSDWVLEDPAGRGTRSGGGASTRRTIDHKTKQRLHSNRNDAPKQDLWPPDRAAWLSCETVSPVSWEAGARLERPDRAVVRWPAPVQCVAAPLQVRRQWGLLDPRSPA